jgi:tRNA pseudouridine55 synthase
VSESNPPAFGLTLLVDKPYEWTSFDVVNKLRYTAKHATGRKKIKVGHAGTLDPLATGLMIVCVGSHTKQINDLMGLPKQYTGSIQLGSTTPSYDLETEIDQTFDLPPFDAGKMERARLGFLGQIEQMPPAFSAKKVDGKKAYELARKGKDVALKPALVSIERFDLECSAYPRIDFVLNCSKGTYVRSLAHDLGKVLGVGGHLTSLRRTEIGPYQLQNAHSLDSAMDAIRSAFEAHQHH